MMELRFVSIFASRPRRSWISDGPSEADWTHLAVLALRASRTLLTRHALRTLGNEDLVTSCAKNRYGVAKLAEPLCNLGRRVVVVNVPATPRQQLRLVRNVFLLWAWARALVPPVRMVMGQVVQVDVARKRGTLVGSINRGGAFTLIFAIVWYLRGRVTQGLFGDRVRKWLPNGGAHVWRRRNHRRRCRFRHQLFLHITAEDFSQFVDLLHSLRRVRDVLLS
mmetsp:Transcript_44687/g.96071  ORF Transcript_44687/g.96071 Transcript_44687/m.96071 type:complete len:222 (-) Transcript_44687:687-1352(-)